MNKTLISGNLTKDPVLGTTSSGIAKCTFTVAVTRTKKEKDGTRKADFVPITTWGSLAENCSKYLSKGRHVEVEAHIQTDSYEPPNGEKTRYSTFFIADKVEFGPAGQRRPEKPEGAQEDDAMADDGDLPF